VDDRNAHAVEIDLARRFTLESGHQDEPSIDATGTRRISAVESERPDEHRQRAPTPGRGA